jgi:hypothetical protein
MFKSFLVFISALMLLVELIAFAQTSMQENDPHSFVVSPYKASDSVQLSWVRNYISGYSRRDYAATNFSTSTRNVDVPGCIECNRRTAKKQRDIKSI